MLEVCDWFGDGSVLVLDVPLACCAIETQAAADGRPMAMAESIPDGGALVVALSGTITHAVAPSIHLLLDGLPRTPTVVAFGACACVGGPYWDSYSVAKGAADVGVAVDHFIPGCPPPPEALHAVLEGIRRA